MHRQNLESLPHHLLYPVLYHQVALTLHEEILFSSPQKFSLGLSKVLTHGTKSGITTKQAETN